MFVVSLELVVVSGNVNSKFSAMFVSTANTYACIRPQSLLGPFALFLRECEIGSSIDSCRALQSKNLPCSQVFQRNSDLGNAWFNNGYMYGNFYEKDVYFLRESEFGS